jgi:hypothetical protein
VAEVLVQFSDPIVDALGNAYIARACGSEMPDGLWQGWIEFLGVAGNQAVRTGRETTQPNRQDTFYWATGLTAVYLEGALERARKTPVRGEPVAIAPPVFDGPASLEPPPAEEVRPLPDSILNPFSVFRNGEATLRSRLSALAPHHLVNVIRAHALSNIPEDALARMNAPALIELIVAAVKVESETHAR